ncbi:Aste57867_24821 [Aphanomyces stellatus]|uniref:Aste57867_24821 protein n=1 Tax=Aphanomyces stellatus TaxID=120398 RepID=A0A485LRI4_9STRA|nr:hypothetical protein As57867_024743 [Aphanomyces stellatus]VFU01456.1 Aste57867_24821 [Aphanomyces stellatus]
MFFGGSRTGYTPFYVSLALPLASSARKPIASCVEEDIQNDPFNSHFSTIFNVMALARVSPIQRVHFRGVDVHIKRDDVHFLSGNKFRKLFWLTEKDDAFYARNHILSYGGVQSNAMLAIAQLAQLKRVPFTYFTRSIPPHVFERTRGLETNFKAATALGMRHVQLPDTDYTALANTHDFAPVAPSHAASWLGVPQGVAVPEAELGVRQLALELNDFGAAFNNNVAVVLPCGTGTTAHYLAKHVHPAMQVYGVPCVGGRATLQAQLLRHGASEATLQRLRVLDPRKRVAFGTLWKPLLEMHDQVLAETGVELDLVYGCPAWDTLFHALATDEAAALFRGREIVYVHCGGLTGNASQIDRYKKTFGGAR